jgi:acyl-CoA thioesterase
MIPEPFMDESSNAATPEATPPLRRPLPGPPMVDPDTVPPGDVRRDTTPQPVEGVDGRYEFHLSDAWRIFYAFGGITMASAIRAAVVAVDREDLHIITADATFAQAIPCGPVAAQVEVLRQGRTGAQALVRMWALDPEQPDPAGPVGSDLVVTCVFGNRSDSSFTFIGAVPPDVAGPDDCVPRSVEVDSPFSKIPYHRQNEFRPAFGVGRLGDVLPPSEPRTASWFRFKSSPFDDTGRWEPALLAAPGDILGPAAHAGVGTQAGFFLVISLQISMHFVGDARTEWLLQHTRAHLAAEGYCSGTAELWDQDRNLVAIATQLARLQPLG